ncbi:MAG: hypothetical protein IT247_03770, partial [Bacteroidia bacterium]|nr:hypothetical protein [Bacteroidia bacterium]
MTSLFENFEHKDTDELIVIANGTTEDWQQAAIDKAKEVLSNRGIPLNKQLERLSEIKSIIDEVNQFECNSRKTEDYSIYEKITMVIWWPREILWGWGLKRDGYELKAKRRLQLVGVGIALSVLLFCWVDYKYKIDEEKRIEEINKTDISPLEKDHPYSDNVKKEIHGTNNVYLDTLNSGHAYSFIYPQKYLLDRVENCIYIGRENPDTSLSKTQPDWCVCIEYKDNLGSEREYLKTHHSENLQKESSINEPVYCKTDNWQIGNYIADRYRYFTRKNNTYIS